MGCNDQAAALGRTGRQRVPVFRRDNRGVRGVQPGDNANVRENLTIRGADAYRYTHACGADAHRYAYTHADAHRCAYTHAYAHRCAYTHPNAYANAYRCACTYAYAYTNRCAYTYAYAACT